jgi:hypothetical protein
MTRRLDTLLTLATVHLRLAAPTSQEYIEENELPFRVSEWPASVPPAINV